MDNILVVDDDSAARELVARALEGDGFKVARQSDGQDALAAVAAAPTAFKVMVSDVEMPGLDGIELVETARALAPSLKFLLVSGYPQQLERAKLAAKGQLAVLSKPFTLEDIRKAVRALLS